MCTKTGAQIADEDEQLWRNVNPSWLDGGEPSSQAFRPGGGDEGCVSTHRASMISAAASHAIFTSASPIGLGLSSVGVWSILVREARAEKLEAWDDPQPPSAAAPQNPAHAVIDMAHLDDKARRRVGQRLKQLSIARGRCHP